MSISQYTPKEIPILATLVGGTAVYLNFVPEWISQLFEFRYYAGLQIGLILLLFLPVILTLARVTKMMNSQVLADGGQVTADPSFRSQPTIWGGYGGAVVGVTFGLPFGIGGVVAGAIIGATVGNITEYIYLNYISTLRRTKTSPKEGNARDVEVSRPARQASSADPSESNEKTEEEGVKEPENEGYSHLKSVLDDDMFYIRRVGLETGHLMSDIYHFRRTIETSEYHFEIHQTEDSIVSRHWSGLWNWMLIDSEGEVEIQGKGEFWSPENTIESIKELQDFLPEGEVFVVEESTFRLYKDESGDWMWRVVSRANDETLVESDVGYEDQKSLAEAIEEFQQSNHKSV